MRALLSAPGAFFLLLGRAANELRHFARLPHGGRLAAGTLAFRCNICDWHGALDLPHLEREERGCLGCGSTLRQRALVAALSRRLFNGLSLPLTEWPRDDRLDVVGISDSDLIERALTSRFRYRNTYLHRQPVLDLRAPPEQDRGRWDVVICSDVLEHVPPPAAGALAGLRALLRPGGFALITVPCSPCERTVEHFPALHDYRILDRAGRRTLVNHLPDGRTEEFDNLVFHGGPGATLEMRHFALVELEYQLREAGFGRIDLMAEPAFEHGVYWREPYSMPLIANCA